MKNKLGRIIENNLFMLRYIFRFTPGLLVYVVLLKILTAVASVLSGVFTMTFLVDSYQINRPMSQVVAYLVGYVIFNLINTIVNSIYKEIYLPKKKLVLAEKMQTELYTKAIAMDLKNYDDADFYNDFIWAMSQSEGQAISVLENLGAFIQCMTAILGIGAIILALDPIGIVFAVVSFILRFIVTFKENKIQYEMDLETKEVQRHRDYTNRVFYQLDFIKEIRLSHVEEKLTDDFRRHNKKLMSRLRFYANKLLKLDFIKLLFSRNILINGVYMFVVLYKAIVLQSLTYGAVIGLLNGCRNLQMNLLNIARCIPKFSQQSLYIERFRKFLDHENEIRENPDGLKIGSDFKEIELKNVNFTYESNDAPTLKNINIKINAGQKIALVGYNGAGKSTLIKLILRLYEVNNGSVLVNGQNIKDYCLKDYRNLFGVVFQDYKLFAADISENVQMDLISNGADREVVEQALEKSGFTNKLSTLGDGIDTPLTREFSKKGIELSGGEAQKIAIARVFAKDCQIVVLDEPSSALDPISEYEINERMMNVANNKTVIFISHRLSTTVIADKIYMLENGEIIEEGSHNELMRMNGKYAQMFKLQAEKYMAE